MKKEVRRKIIETSAKIAGALFLVALTINAYENYIETCNMAGFIRRLTGVPVLGCVFVAGWQCIKLELDD